MSSQSKIIWVLSDDRPGNYSQALGLAEKMAEELAEEIKTGSLPIVQIKKITYNFLSKLPNFLKINGLLGIDRSSKASLLQTSQKPNIPRLLQICKNLPRYMGIPTRLFHLGGGTLCAVKNKKYTRPKGSEYIIVSAGRKTAPIAAFLKNYYQAFAIQIMNPNWDFKKFDAVILPNHDSRSFFGTKEKNVLRINGSLGRIDHHLLELEYKKFASLFDKISSPKIALLVGGSSKKGKFTIKIAQDLGKIISKITNQMQGNLLVLNSRRTGEEITETLDKSLILQYPQSKTFFKWQKADWKNPYFATLKAADFIVATGDSISMCSEICSLGKPVYIFNPPEICSPKHLKFHQDLFEQKYARKLDENTKILENYPTKKLEETSRIAKLLANKYS